MTAVSLMKEYDTYDEFCQAMPEIHMALTATDTLFAQPVRVDRSTMRGRVSELLEAAKATLDELNLKLQVTNCAGDEAAQQRILAQITDAATGKLCRNTVNVKLYTGHAGDASLLRLITKMGFCTWKWGAEQTTVRKVQGLHRQARHAGALPAGVPETATGGRSSVQANREPAAEWTITLTTIGGQTRRQEDTGLDQVHPQRRTRQQNEEKEKASSV